jgi:putative transposase
MPGIETLSHTKGDCKHHGVFIPTYRRTALSHERRRPLGDVLRALAAQKACRIEGRVSKVEMTAPMALINKALFPSISTFATPPACR